MIARGRVERVDAALLVARVVGAAVGDGVRVAGEGATGEVRRIDGSLAYVAMHGGLDGMAAGSEVWIDPSVSTMALGTCALGRAIDARGLPLDGGARVRGRTVWLGVAAPARRVPVVAALWTGIRAIDGLLCLGVGARIGIFGPPGAGKSTLLDALARARADAVVVALVGERGREAQRWVECCDPRTTVVCATSDRPAAERVRAVHVALAHAAALRERGLDVLVLLDSLARTAGALRELGVAAGESVGRGGYPPSVFAQLARLVEVCGATATGSITLVATVLDDGEERDPVSDAARSLLDGHVQLSAKLARAGRFPAIDVPASASRTMASVVDARHACAAGIVREAAAALERTEDARSLGIAVEGELLQAALRCERELDAFLRQDAEPYAPEQTRAALFALAALLQGNAAATER
ncbi:MAG TPA: EscN/YscN/HrcN family type III secretion system ATPase [Candidatus Dormibacteraeota bacterium]|nr:EscN/YscN/HrcN family type III secretion system ATPase [Candidatus Dormibacteraeota bacterium]